MLFEFFYAVFWPSVESEGEITLQIILQTKQTTTGAQKTEK